MQRGSPPSVYAVQALLEGRKGAWKSVGQETLRRTVLIAPGLYLAGLRGRELFRATAYASASITAGLIAYYSLRHPKDFRKP